MISFAGGLPAPDVFPVERFEEACHKVLTQQAASALQYGATEGYEPLRELIANNMARYGIKAKVENVLITSGSQQALDLIGKLFINRRRSGAGGSADLSRCAAGFQYVWRGICVRADR